MVNLRHMYHVVAAHEGHHLVGLYYHRAGTTYGSQRIVATDTQRAVALIVRRRSLEDCHLAGYLVTYHLGHIVEIGWEEVTFKVVHRLTRIAAEEVTHVTEMTIAARM